MTHFVDIGAPAEAVMYYAADGAAHISDLFYSDPSLRRQVTGRNVFNCCLEQPPQISLGAGRAQYGNSPRYLCQLRDKARWANCAQ